VGLAKGAHKLGSGHAGHDVVGDDGADVGGKAVLLELFQRARRVERGDYGVAGAAQNGLARGGLDSVVVDEQHGG
jgi:hypothetical protein